MPTLQRKRRAPPRAEDDSDEDTSRTASFATSNTAPRQPQPTQRRHRSPSTSSASAHEDPDIDQTASSKRHAAFDLNSPAHAALVKSLIRLGLATTYTRTPLRRADIIAKVFQPASAPPKAFKTVFEEAQHGLRRVFGMELVELPGRERAAGGITARRAAATQAANAAAKSQGQTPGQTQTAMVQDGSTATGTALSNKAWVLVTALPAQFRTPGILGPAHNPTPAMDTAYMGLVTFIVSLIALSGGSLAEGKLDRYLRRVNADMSTPVDQTQRLLSRMVKEGYIEKVKEAGGAGGGETEVEYLVGPRGKVEIGADGVKGIVRGVYKEPDGEVQEQGDAQENGEDDLEKRLERSLKVGLSSAAFSTTRIAGPGVRTAVNGNEAVELASSESNGARKRGRPKKSGQRQENEDEDED